MQQQNVTLQPPVQQHHNKQLQLQQLSFHYGSHSILHEINLTLQPGQLMVLAGPSGCGKSSLLHLCAGLLPVAPTQLNNSFERSACLFQEPRLLPWKNTLDNLALGLKAQGENAASRRQKAIKMAQQLELPDSCLHQYPAQLSGGMQSRVALGRMLLTQPDLLLLDEPFAALDIGLKEKLYRQLLQYQRQHHAATLLITHDLAEAVMLADVIVVMQPDPGQIADIFYPAIPQPQRTADNRYQLYQQLLARPQVRKAFGLSEHYG